MKISLLLFVFGVLLMTLSGTDGHIENMNTVSYIGLGFIVLGISYTLLKSLFDYFFVKKQK